jgi:endogenous inhibitor of DNA gyrase (YacG/DUF329 family)
MSEDDQLRPGSVVSDADQGGDEACWLHMVCPECGRFVPAESEESAEPVGTRRCPECGAELP